MLSLKTSIHFKVLEKAFNLKNLACYFQNIIADHAVSVIKAVDPDKEMLYLYLPFQSVHAPLEVKTKSRLKIL